LPLEDNKMKKCSKCGIEKPLDGFSNDKNRKYGKYPHCKECVNQYKKDHKEEAAIKMKRYREDHKEEIKEQRRDYYHNGGGREKVGCTAMKENNSCPQYLGIVINERLIKHLFPDAEMMPMHFPGYDFTCRRGKKVNAKASTTFIRENKKSNTVFWYFNFLKNKIPDFFLCVAYSSVENPTPLHIWMVPGKEINYLSTISINSSTIHKWDQWRMDVDKAQACCTAMKDDKSNYEVK